MRASRTTVLAGVLSPTMLPFSLLLVFLFVASCAVPSGRALRVDCNTLGLTPVTNPEQRIQGHGFSILPPTGRHWCLNQTDPRNIIVNRNLFGGRVLTERPPLEEIAHTFGVQALAVEIEGPTLNTPDELKAFVERWLRAGFSMRCTDLGCVLHERPQPRRTLIESEVAVDTSPGTDCVRYRQIFEERDNPNAPDFVLILNEPDSLLCFHPDVAGLFIWISYSERYPQHEEPEPLLVETLRPEVERVSRSLTFTQVN